MSLEYIFSQIIVIIGNIFLASSYATKKRLHILILNIAATSFFALAYVFLGAWTGMAMLCVSIPPPIIFFFLHKNAPSTKITKIDTMILLILLTAIGVIAVFTYDGIFSLLPVFATVLFIFGIWQKNHMVYRLLGIPTNVLWLSYNIYVNNFVGIISIILLLVFIVAKIILDYKPLSKSSSK